MSPPAPRDGPGALDAASALAVARAAVAAAGPAADAPALARAVAVQRPAWPAGACRDTAREAVLLRDLLGPAGSRDGGAAALALCLARPRSEPLWRDFERLQRLLGELEAELRAQRRRARLPGAAGRRAATDAAGTRTVLARAAAEFAAMWSSGVGAGPDAAREVAATTAARRPPPADPA